MPYVYMSPKEAYRINVMSKAKRVEIAEYYRDNPHVTIRAVMAEFKVSYYTVHRALHENGVETERGRNPIHQGVHYEHHTWSCGTKVRHYCNEQCANVQRGTLQRVPVDVSGIHVDPADIAAALAARDPSEVARIGQRYMDAGEDSYAAFTAALQHATVSAAEAPPRHDRQPV